MAKSHTRRKYLFFVVSVREAWRDHTVLLSLSYPPEVYTQRSKKEGAASGNARRAILGLGESNFAGPHTRATCCTAAAVHIYTQRRKIAARDRNKKPDFSAEKEWLGAVENHLLTRVTIVM